jgi:hypothetical protein
MTVKRNRDSHHFPAKESGTATDFRGAFKIRGRQGID